VGIRIKKIMGYGFDDVKINKDKEIDDPRFNNYKKSDDESERYYDRLDKFPTWLVESKDAWTEALHKIYSPEEAEHHTFSINLTTKMLEKKQIKSDMYGTIVHESECGLPKVFIIRPFDQSDWFRSDDTMDYHEQKSMKPKVNNHFTKGSSCGIYPYTGMHLKPGRENKLSDEFKEFMTVKNNYLTPSWYNQLTGRWDKKMPAIIKDEQLMNHLENDWYPDMAPTAVLQAYYMNIFSDTKYIFDLQPMIYTYWS
jgi:hypothetical protein